MFDMDAYFAELFGTPNPSASTGGMTRGIAAHPLPKATMPGLGMGAADMAPGASLVQMPTLPSPAAAPVVKAPPIAPPMPAPAPAEAGAPVLNGLKSLFAPASAAPAAAPNAPAEKPGFLSQAGSFLGDAAAGMSEKTEAGHPLRAFAQGFAGAQKSGQSRAEAARKRTQEDEEQKWHREEHEWKGEDRGIEAEERRLDRNSKYRTENRLDSAEERAGEKDRREAKSDSFKRTMDLWKMINPAPGTEIEKIMSAHARGEISDEVADGLTQKLMPAAREQVLNKLRTLESEDQLSPGDRAVLKETDPKRKKPDDEFGNTFKDKPPAGAAPKEPPPPAKVPDPAKPPADKNTPVATSQAAPAKPASPEEFQALPPLSWFINPADGRVLQKKPQ